MKNNTLTMALVAILLGMMTSCTMTPDTQDDTARDMANRATTGPAVAGDREVDVDPKTQYTNMGGDNQMDQATLDIKRDINNAATGSSQFAFQSNASLAEANRMVTNDALLTSYSKAMERITVLVVAAEDLDTIAALTTQLESVGAKYTARHDAIMERAAGMGTMNLSALTNLTVTNNSFTVAGAEAKPLPDSYAEAAASIVDKVAQLKARSGGGTATAGNDGTTLVPDILPDDETPDDTTPPEPGDGGDEGGDGGS